MRRHRHKRIDLPPWLPRCQECGAIYSDGRWWTVPKDDARRFRAEGLKR